MKKGFTMIELIFVIVILGILASVAIPRLAATKEDAEISATVANLRTLVSDASAYYTAKGEFPSTTKWSEITNVPLKNATATVTTNDTNGANLKVGGKDCIGVKLVNKDGAKPAHIVFTKDGTNSNSGVCKEVVNSAPVKAYIDSKVTHPASSGSGTTDISNAIVVGSSTSVYTTK
ncbi:type II secretion system protein [Campylobacter sp.]|uniref:type II secretion system protein n=1 Tax=Campylobacter sp. TaxID=205 RepID=UPI002A752D99|nr:type II secretion system protein [Campylobacter sp.]MDY3245548.1 type II secretion system protein [Campylobacter sp.]MDY3663331.1 type II secretion system protein [Campylobacter sp.]MDY4012800.1 type II secretion system protein [Campylobacter sp.]